MNLIIF